MGYKVSRRTKERMARGQARARALAEQREASSIKGLANRQMSPAEARAVRERLAAEIDELLIERDAFVERFAPPPGDYALGRFDEAIFGLKVNIAQISINLATGFYQLVGVNR